MQRYSGRDRLWFMVVTGVVFGRFSSPHLPLRIEAVEEGLMPVSGEPRHPS